VPERVSRRVDELDLDAPVACDAAEGKDDDDEPSDAALSMSVADGEDAPLAVAVADEPLTEVAELVEAVPALINVPTPHGMALGLVETNNKN
jgi:hypothetical protein